MARRHKKRCDWCLPEGSCGKPAYEEFKGSSDSHRMSAYWCQEHGEQFVDTLNGIGVKIESVVRVDYKDRAAYVAASGKTFTTMDARPWLMEQGLVSSQSGRIHRDLIKLYGDAH